MTSQKPPLQLGKKRKIGETIIESLIRGLSFISIIAIALIFFFVFKEASPVFFGKPNKVVTRDSSSTTHNESSKTAVVIDSSSATMKTVETIKAKNGIKGTEITVKMDAAGNKKKFTKGGGKIEQEVYDPLADDATPTKDTAATPVTPAKPKEIKKEEPKPTAAKETTPTNKKYSTTNGGSVEQEVYDPFADEKGGIATIPGQKNSKVKSSSDTGSLGDSADPTVIAQTQLQIDSSALQESKDSLDRAHAGDFSNLLFGDTWQPVSNVPKFGFLPLFIGTLKVTLISILFGAPLAILAALFTSTFAPKWARETLKPIIELLAGLPSVVVGFFALIVMATIFQDLLGYQYRLNSFVGGIAMSFAVIPIIYTISEDALTAVPNTLRDASTALGATKWQTAFKVVLPSAIPGVFAAVILGFGRAFGETMIALMATGNAAMSTASPFDPIRTFAATIGAEMAEVVFGDQHYNILFLIGAMLFVFTFTSNALVEFYVRKRLIRRIQGK